MKKNKVIYALTVKDIQTVANDEIERDLTVKEIDLIKEAILEKIDWYDPIANAINEKFGSVS